MNIRDSRFQPLENGVDFPTLEKSIHAVLADGRIVSGMDAIRAAYRAIGLGWLVAPTGWPLLRPFFDGLYSRVARNRQAISRFFQ